MITRSKNTKATDDLSDELCAVAARTENGVVYDTKPVKMHLKAGKYYLWCLCGKSLKQPLCDGTHDEVALNIGQRPVRFKVDKTKDYLLCNCKQTKNRPFCDGSHKKVAKEDDPSNT